MELATQRNDLEKRIDGVLSSFEERASVPDRWEGEWLSKAMSQLSAGYYQMAEHALRRIEVPASDRSPEELTNLSEHDPVLSTKQHRANFEQIRLLSR